MRSIDIFALLVSAIVTIVLTTNMLRKTKYFIRPIPAFFMFFGPSTILVHMSCHIGEISFNAINNMISGTFKYDFRFYSLMLMTAVLVFCCGVLLQRIRKFLEENTYIEVLKVMAAIIFISAPTIPFTPIGSLPIIACLITISAMPFVKRIRKVVTLPVMDDKKPFY